VYEEIERGGVGIGGVGEIQVSDMSDEDGRRQSDMSRQSSRSYGDHRPLIPYSPANDRLIQYGQSIDRNGLQYDSQYSPAQERALNAYWEKLRRQPPKLELGEMNRMPGGTYGIQQQDHTRTVAVLDGHTVVCHLQPQTDMYTGRGVPPPSYSEC
jgi:latrophilin 1